MGKYFNVTVKPAISVTALAAGNIDDTEILFDWHGFDIPKGAARLIGMTILYTGKNGVDYTPTDFELFWGKANMHQLIMSYFGRNLMLMEQLQEQWEMMELP